MRRLPLKSFSTPILIACQVLPAACLLVLSLGTSRTVPAQPAAAWDFSSLLERTCNLERLHEPSAHRVGMASSYDRTLANNDAFGCIRKEGDRYLMADLKGPGAVVRIWTGTAIGRIWIYVDDAEKPLVDTEFKSLFLGGEAPFVEPFVSAQAKSGNHCYHWCYVPIPYAKSCRIYLSQIRYFQASYLTFPPGTRVETLSLPLAERHQQTLREASARFVAGATPTSVRGETIPIEAAIAPGQTAELASHAGPAVIRALRLGWDGMDPQLGRQLTLTAAWDGEASPSVQAPLLDFFGCGFKSMALGRDDAGRGYCYFPMPFAKSGVLRVANDSTTAVVIRGELIVDRAAPLPAALRTFHASWRREPETRPAILYGPPTADGAICDPQLNYLVADIKGRGHYIATMRHSDGPPEGDEYVFVDGESAPGSLPGTGYEDYFDMAWGPQPMDAPLGGGKRVLGAAETFRFHRADPLEFDKSLRFTFEVYCGNNGRFDYDTTGYWYQEEPHAPLPAMPPAGARRFRTLDPPPLAEYVFTPEPTRGADANQPARWRGQPVLPTECESLKVLSSSGGRAEPMSMLDEGPDWCGGAQLVFKPSAATAQATEGGFSNPPSKAQTTSPTAAGWKTRPPLPDASFTVPLPPVDSDGWHALTLRWTTGPEYGIARLSANGPHRLLDLDGTAPQRGARTTEVGAVWRARHDNAMLTFAAPGSGWIGLDWLKLESSAEPLSGWEVAGPFDLELGDLVVPLKPKWRPCPPAQGPTREQLTKLDARRRQQLAPSPSAVDPARGVSGRDSRGYLLKLNLEAPQDGVYRLEWKGRLPAPDSIEVNSATVAQDPRRFTVASPGAGQSRRYYAPLRAGDNELRCLVRSAPGQWFTLLGCGTAAPPETRLIAGAIKVTASQGDTPRVQDGPRGRVWFTPKAPGAWFEVALPIAAPGRKTISLILTRARDYGIFQLSLDGKPLGEPFDGYHGLAPAEHVVLKTDEIAFGAAELFDGNHTLRFEVVGKNEQSVGYMVGVNEILVRSAPGP